MFWAWGLLKAGLGWAAGGTVAAAKSHSAIALAVAGVAAAAVLVVVGVWGIGVRDERIAEQATQQCEAEQEAARLRTEVGTLKKAIDEGKVNMAARDASIEAQRELIARLDLEKDELRRASANTHDPRGVMFRVDDPWLRASTGSNAARGGGDKRDRAKGQ